MSNINNYGHIAGTLAEKPEVKEMSNGCRSISFVVTTKEDNSDKDSSAHRRSNQKVKLNCFVADADVDLSRLEALNPGHYFESDFWIESYTFTTEDGQEKLVNSLKISLYDIKLKDVPEEFEDIPGDELDDFDSTRHKTSSTNVKDSFENEYPDDSIDYDFMDDDMLDDMARSGDYEAKWYANTYRGGDYDL